jgi:hypothetical protein
VFQCFAEGADVFRVVFACPGDRVVECEALVDRAYARK